jgi:hypothetical protein
LPEGNNSGEFGRRDYSLEVLILSETIQIIVALILLIGVFIGTRFIIGWRIQRSGFWVLKDLERRGAVSPDTAVELPYAKKDWMKIGLRDYRHKALEQLVMVSMVGRTENGRFFIVQR